MTAEELETNIDKRAEGFGLFTQSMKDKDGRRGTPNAMKRSNISHSSFADGKAYFGYVRPEEAPSGAYYDLSFVIFPQENNGKCIVSIVVGSAGFQRDYDIACTAGIRRLFTQLTKKDGYSFIKNDFTNIDSQAKDLLCKIDEDDDLSALHTAIATYSKVILAACIVDPDTEFFVIAGWLAQYAKLRNWGNKSQQQKQNDALKLCLNKKSVNVQKDINTLLKNRRFVILQGAPGTGKTYNALKISEKYDYTHFIQFHAETTYSDFVDGIRPSLGNQALTYEYTRGELVKAIETAIANKEKKVLLIVDEINRANLANVLGPVFFLFEDQAGKRNAKVNIAGHELSELPKNLDVIATMNTADRSIAVVDFALRRRFSWYTIRPQEIIPSENQVFHKTLFNRFCEIFAMYATDEELNLQPGPSYFLTQKDKAEEIMTERMVYELMPLIKEYLSEGLMSKAADSFSQLFYEYTNRYLFE